MHKEKILVIRFNSIGDIVLTFPAVRALFDHNYEVHYLCKKSYASLLKPNPRIHKIWTIEKNVQEVLEELKEEQFTYIIDLHNNLRSRQVKSHLKIQANTLIKHPISNFLLTQLNIKVGKRGHIVNRFLETVSPICRNVQDRSLELFIPEETRVKVDGLGLPQDYLAISVGAAYATKQIPAETIAQVIERIKIPVVLLGGNDDKKKAETIISLSQSQIINLVGKVDILSSAEIIKRSKCLLTGDTGLLHIASALRKNVVAVYGSTHPTLGYTPNSSDDNFQFRIVQNEDLTCRPCTKQGKKKCPKGHFRCMTEIDADTIVDNILSLVDARN